MTFSLVGRCARTGRFGAAVATSSIAVGSRVTFAKAGVGAMLSQFWADPTLGPRGLDLLQAGCTAREAMDALVASTGHRARRQLAIIDRDGNTASHTGSVVKPHLGEAHVSDAVVIGNILANDDVVPAVASAFEAAASAELPERLLAALSAGLEAGGEEQPLRSAALLVVDKLSFPYVDLRVDMSADPIGDLAALWKAYAPLTEQYVLRVVDPHALDR